MDSGGKEAQRDLQIPLYWKQISMGLQELFSAQEELYKRIEKILRPTIPKQETDLMPPDTGLDDLCTVACDFVRVRDDIRTQLRHTVNVLERLEI